MWDLWAHLGAAKANHILLVAAVGVVLTAPRSSFAPPTAPNDKFSNRIVLTGTNVVVSGSNTNATKEAGEPNHAGNVGGRSIWWSWTAPTNGDLTITTDGSAHADGSEVDTLLGVYTGSSVSALTVVASNDDHAVFVTSRIRFEAVAATQYQIAVDGYNYDTNGYPTNADSGNITLSLVFLPEPIVRPANDNFTNSAVLAGLPVNVSAQNVEATREANEPIHAGQYGDASVWWSWTAPSNDTVQISTAGSAFDTMLAVYTGTALTNLSVVASNDDADPADGILTSLVTFPTVSGQTYRIAVDGYDGAFGQIALSINSVVPRLSAPELVPGGWFQFTVNGLAGRVYEIDVSGDLGAGGWAPVGTLTNTTGTGIFVDSAGTNFGPRYYRALLQ